MIAGKLGSAEVPAGVWTLIYTLDFDSSNVMYGTISILVCNLTTSDGLLKVALSSSDSSPTGGEDYIEYNKFLQKNGGVVERGGIVISEGESILIYSTVDVAVRVHGFVEELI